MPQVVASVGTITFSDPLLELINCRPAEKKFASVFPLGRVYYVCIARANDIYALSWQFGNYLSHGCHFTFFTFLNDVLFSIRTLYLRC
jgi:hypothetical protein